MNSLLQAVQSLDFSVYHFMNGFAGNWFFDRLASHEESDNLIKGGLYFSMYASCWFRTGHGQEQRRRAIFAILCGTLLTLLVSRTIAEFAPYRTRPMYEPSLQHRAYSFPISTNMENWSSFPSDTAAYFCALAFGLAHVVRRYRMAILLFTAVWICLPRLFLGAHYLSDIVVGAGIGVAIVQGCLKWAPLQGKLATCTLRLLEASPHVFYACGFLMFFEMGVLFDDLRRPARGLFAAFHPRPIGRLLPLPTASLLFLGVVLVMALIVFGAIAKSYLRSRSVKIIWRQKAPLRTIRGRDLTNTGR